MTVRAISHQIVITIQSTSDGSTAYHPHDTLDLLFSYFLMTHHQTFSMHSLTNFHRSNNHYTRQWPKTTFHSLQKSHDFASIIAFAAFSCPYCQLFSSLLSSHYSDAVVILTDAQPLLSLSLADSSLLSLLPASEGYFENIPPKSGPLTTHRKTHSISNEGSQ